MKYYCTLIVFLCLFTSCSFLDRHEVVGELPSQKQSPKIDLKKHEAIMARGKAIYDRDCEMCHAKNKKCMNLLRNIEERMPLRYLTLYITKYDSLRRAKDPYVMRMQEEYSGAAPLHDNTYTKEELTDLLIYILED